MTEVSATAALANASASVAPRPRTPMSAPGGKVSSVVGMRNPLTELAAPVHFAVPFSS